MLAVVAVALGLSIGLLGGGSVRALERLNFRHEWVLVVLFVVQGVSRGRIPGTSAISTGMVIWAAASAGLMALLTFEVRETGVWAVLLGVAANLLVVLLNAGMPVVLGPGVRPSTAGASISASAGFYHLASVTSIAPALADSLPIRVMGSRFFMSAGDLLIAVGIAMFIARAMIFEPVRPV